jgi:fatty-acyl-CoA synthase
MVFETPNLECVIRTIKDHFSDKTALKFESLDVSYAELFRYANNLAVNLKKDGVKAGDKVAVILPNCPEYLYVYFALFLIGAWVVPANTRWEPGELEKVLLDADAGTVIYKNYIGTFDYHDILEGIKEKLPELKHLVEFRPDEQDGQCLLSRYIYKDCKALYNDGDYAAPKPEEVALLAYTSGTTGTPKGVMISHQTLVLTSWHTARLWSGGNEVGFSVAPLYAAQGFLAVLINLVAGLTMKFHSTFDPHEIVKELAKGDVNLFHTQPTMWTLLLGQAYMKHLNFDHLDKVVVSGSLCPADLAVRIEKTMGCTLLNGYGLIEATGVVTLTRPDDPEDVRCNTVGRPIPGVEMKVVDENRNPCAPGEVGELAVRGYLMKGYYKNEAKTREVIDEQGWLYTGDLACVYDEKGNVQIKGRSKDMVIRGGFNVYPIDIEECLINHELVEDVAVVGRPDEILGESLVAFVIPKPFAAIGEGDVKRF